MTEEQIESHSESPLAPPTESPKDLSSPEAPIEPPPSKWSDRVRELGKKWLQKWRTTDLKKSIEKLDPQTLLDWTTRTVQKRGATFYGILATVTLSTYFLANLTAILLVEFIPEPPVQRGAKTGFGSGRSRSI